jgi:hypothetical protein
MVTAHQADMYQNQGKEAGIVLIGLIREITCHQPLIRLDLYMVHLVCCDEFQAVVIPCTIRQPGVPDCCKEIKKN